MKEENNMSSDEQVWDDYLEQRPELKKWWQFCLDHSYVNSTYEKVSDDIRVNRVHILKMQGIRFRRMALMHDQVLADGRTDDGKRLLDLDDGEALAYTLDIDKDDSYRMMMESHAIKNVNPPSLNYKEALSLYLHNSGADELLYINLVYAREHPESSEQSKPFMDNIDSIFHYLVYWKDAGLNHTVWNTEQDLIRTIHDYRDYYGLFLMPTESDTIIDSDYLDHFLLVPKPYPNEINRRDWHDRAVRFVDTIDGNAKDHRRMDYIDCACPINFLELVYMSLLDCFLTHNIEDLAFMESMYWFCIDVADDSGIHNMEAGSYQPGKLDPKVFDLFREYGAAFAKPLLESVLSDMNPVEEKRTS